jgi:DNA processing protein
MEIILKQNFFNLPNKLFYLGNKNLLNEEKIIAVVGSRKMSDYGKEVIGKIVPELVKNNFCIISGMAFGVDAEAQKTVLDYGGKTIAVLGSGVDVVSPKGNQWLYERILKENGLIVSEYVLGTQPSPQNFLARNRIIAGLSQGVLVIEGGKRSGTLVTAKYAIEQGKEVMAVPGRITEENSIAPNFLIKNGIQIVTEVSDIIRLWE